MKKDNKALTSGMISREEVITLLEMFMAVTMASNKLIDELEIKTEKQAKDKEHLYQAYEKIYSEFLIRKPANKEDAQ